MKKKEKEERREENHPITSCCKHGAFEHFFHLLLGPPGGQNIFYRLFSLTTRLFSAVEHPAHLLIP
jgi:hypothetical protein